MFANGGTAWWVTEGEWQPGHPERVIAACHARGVAEHIAADHNAHLRGVQLNLVTTEEA